MKRLIEFYREASSYGEIFIYRMTCSLATHERGSSSAMGTLGARIYNFPTPHRH